MAIRSNFVTTPSTHSSAPISRASDLTYVPPETLASKVAHGKEQSNSFKLNTVESRSLSSGFSHERASLYDLFHSTFNALYIGGTCLIFPIKVLIVESTSSFVMARNLFSQSLSIFFNGVPRSKESLVAEKSTVNR